MTTRRVVCTSSLDGTAMPLGWLCARTTVVALAASAVSTIFRTEIPAEFTLPCPTSLQQSTLHLASRHSKNTVSTFRPKKNGTRYSPQACTVGRIFSRMVLST